MNVDGKKGSKDCAKVIHDERLFILDVLSKKGESSVDELILEVSGKAKGSFLIFLIDGKMQSLNLLNKKL